MESDTVAFEPIRAESTPALIARRLRDAVAHGHFKPGEKLLEVGLSKQFGVSRGLVREAMQRLTQEGLLVSRPNRGVFVAELGPAEVFDIYTARLAVERAACLKVIDVTGRTEELADALDALTNELAERVRDGGDDNQSLASLDIEFHERMVDEAQSPRLSRMHATLATESRMCITVFEGRSYAIEDRISEHRQIAQAIREKNVQLLHRLLAEHMDHAVDSIIQSLE